MARTIARCLCAVVALALAAPAWSADSTSTKSTSAKPKVDLAEMMKVMAEMATPGAEHKKLDPLAGQWTYTMKFWMDPSMPPMELEGTCERKWILGGRFLEEKYAGKGLDGSNFEGCGIMGYDNAQKKFTSGWICNMCTSLSTSTGTVDSSGKKFTFDRECYCPLRKCNVKARDEVRIESNDKVVMESYELEDGKEKKMMELVTTRQK